MGELIKEHDMKELRRWKSALDEKAKKKSRDARSRLEGSRERAQTYTEHVIKNAPSLRIKGWFANMVPEMLDNVDEILKSGTAKKYSREELTKYGYIPSITIAMKYVDNNLAPYLESNDFTIDTPAVPVHLAWGIISDPSAEDFLQRVVRIDEEALKALHYIKYKAMPEELGVSVLEDWAAKPGSFYSAFDITATSVPSEQEFEKIDARNRDAATSLSPNYAVITKNAISYGAVANSLRQDEKAKYVLTDYLRCWIELLNEEKLEARTSLASAPTPGDAPSYDGHIVFTAFEGNKFTGIYDYEISPDQVVRGRMEGTLQSGEVTEPNDNRAVPSIVISAEWYENGKHGTVEWNISSDKIKRRVLHHYGTWTQKAADASGTWMIQIPRPDYSELLQKYLDDLAP